MNFSLYANMAGFCSDGSQLNTGMIVISFLLPKAEAEPRLRVNARNARKVTRVGIINSFQLMAWKPKAFHQLNHPHHSAAQD